MDLMEWYFANDVDDLVVPNNQDQLDSLLLPDRWATAPQKFGSLNKCFVGGTTTTEKELNFDVEMERRGQDGANYSDQSFGIEGSSQHKLANEQLDFQLNDKAETDQMDDIFLSSLFEEDVTVMDNLSEPFCCSPESHFSMAHPAKPNVAPAVRATAVFVQNSWREHLGMETSLEECILQELERVMAQLTDTTRICFRDALYRLAENSKQHEDGQKYNPEILGSPSSLMDHDETTRLDTNESESVTNPIDRAVAFLMFNHMDFNAQDSPASAPATVNEEASGTVGASS